MHFWSSFVREELTPAAPEPLKSHKYTLIVDQASPEF